MRLETLLNITTAAMTALGAILLGMAQEDLLLPILAAMSAGISLIATDWMKWISLSKLLANGLALLAVAYSAFEFASPQSDVQLLTIANLLIYLQIILLFQEKSDRIYWQIIVLSTLQVVVAAAISLRVGFAFWLILYLVLILTELMLFFIYRERQPFLAKKSPVGSKNVPTPRQRSTVPLNMGWLPTVFFRLWPRNRASTLVATLPENEVARIPVWQIGRLVLGFTVTTLVIAILVFFSTPRVGQSWSGRYADNQRLVGFSNEVSLNDLGRILDNPSLVMRVRFRDPETDEPAILFGEPYFRGTIVDRYRPILGTWTQRRMSLVRRVSRLKSPPSQVGLLRQEVRIEPSQQMNLFSVFPIYRCDETSNDVGIDPHTIQLFRTTEDSDMQWEPFQMVALTNALRFGRMRSLMPCENAGRWTRVRSLQSELAFLKSFDQQQLGGIERLATEILDQAKVDRNNPIQVAHVLSAYLEDPTRFEYALDQDRLPPTGVDPVEFFLTTSRRGHCEYYASALVLMLRSQGVPARMVMGFKGGDYNKMGHFYQVRQLHAHAWAEAYIPPEFVRSSYLVEGETANAGGWLRLDPTPVDRNAEAQASKKQRFAAISEAHDYLQMLWDKYVVGLDSERQLSDIYAPIAEHLAAWWKSGRLQIAKAWNGVTERLHLEAWRYFGRRYLTWPALLCSLVISLILTALIYRWRRPLIRMAQRFWQGPARLLDWIFNRTTRRGTPRVGFYHKLERLLARRGMRRAKGQTHREFATEAAAELARLPNGESVAQIPAELVELFYGVRFGRQTLTAGNRQRIDEALKALADVENSAGVS